MKKMSMLLLALVTLTLTTQNGWAQNQAPNNYVSGGLFIQNDNAIENLELGKVIGKNTIALIGQSEQPTISTPRQYSAGLKYYRSVYQEQDLKVQFNSSVQMNLTNDNQSISVEPGFSVNYTIFKNLAIQGAISSPIVENSILFKPIAWRAGLQLVLAF